jgi:pimeloyl-ACP methyl ester carboxylesterase
VLEFRPRAWGEMVVRSISSGEVRTLLPAGPDSFWTGPALYLPQPPQYSYRIRRDADGAGMGMVRSDEAGRATSGEYFSLRQEDIRCDGEGITLAGRVTRIADARRRPGVVILGGSGWRSRQDHEFQQRNLAALGFVVLSYDKRGFGESGGQDPVAFATTAGDAVGAARYLRGRSDVGEVGLFGISRGGWTAPLAASLDQQIAFLILFVPPAASPAVQEHGSRIAQMQQEGRDADDIALADRMLDACWRFLADEDQWDIYQALAMAATERGLPDYVLESVERDPEVWAWARLNMLYDPVPVLENTRIPLLAVFGETDLSVLTMVHRPAMAAALARADNGTVSLVTLPGVGHDLARRADLPIHRSTGQGAEGFDAVMAWIDQLDLLDD